MYRTLIAFSFLTACSGAPPVGDSEDAPSESAAVYAGVTVHLEGWRTHEEDQFERYAQVLRDRADLFEAYGARLTLETKEMTNGIEMWGDNVLLEMQDRGHDVGIHADLGANLDYSTAQMTEDLIRLRERNEDLGLDVRHASGVCSHVDWVTATLDAGFEITSAIVAYCLQSLPEAVQPLEYADCDNPSDCHEAWPEDLAGQLRPRRVRDGASWITPDPEGELVIHTAGGAIICYAEEASGAQSVTDCAFDEADIEAWREDLEAAVALARPGEVLDLHATWSLGSPLSLDLLELWLQTTQPYVDAGQVRWSTLGETHEAYLEWEARQGR